MAVVILTGASSGIGAATAVRLGSRGDQVVLVARRERELRRVADAVLAAGGVAHVVCADLSVPTDTERVVPAALEWAGGLDVLINCAGVGGGRSINTEPALARQILEVNLCAPIRLMHDAIPFLRRQHRGAIVNVGSLAGEVGVRGIYSASKFGLRGITDSVRRELRDTEITVSLIEPAHVDTPLTTGRTRPMPGPGIVVDAIERALVRSYRRLIVPRRAGAVAVAASTFPWLVDRIVAGRTQDHA